MKPSAARPSLLYPAALALVAAALPLAGCHRIEGETGGRPRPYTGPTQPMAEVVAEINANNEKVPTLWASHSYEATVFDEQKQGHFVNGDGALLYRRPLGMRLVGNKPLVGTVFEVGSTDEQYWLKVNDTKLSKMWWGSYEHLGKPCVRPVPIRPDLVLEVLGVGLFDTDLSALPAPVMRFNPDADAYTFVWVVKLPDRWAAQKEVWYDRRTKRPTLVLLFDESGRVQLRANLARHQQVPVEDAPEARWPWVATDYRLYFPDTGTKMAFALTDVELCRNGVPCRRGIVFPGEAREDAGVDEVIQLDKGCAGGK